MADDSGATRPTATARPPRVMMFREMPVTCMITSAARSESGMLTAATSVLRGVSCRPFSDA
jgi:hypothetical protein